MQIWNRYQFTKGNTAFKNEKHMSLVQTYLDNNGYDYYGNAAEDTLVFFVRNEPMAVAEQPGSRSKETNKNSPVDKLNRSSSDTAVLNIETHAEVRVEN